MTTVRELIELLQQQDPDLPLWEVQPFGPGMREAYFTVRPVKIALDPSGKGRPRRADDLPYQNNPDRWSEFIKAVEL